MTEHRPIFFDRVKAHSYHRDERDRDALPGEFVFDSHAHHSSMRNIFSRAVPFVIDDDAIHKAMEVRQEFLLNPKTPLVDLALVPFKETWIEYDPRAKLGDRAGPLTADYMGHLLVRGHANPDGVSVISFEGKGKLVFTAPFVMNWSTNPNITAPWRIVASNRDYHVLDGKAADVVRSVLLGGTNATLLGGEDWLPKWKNRLGGDLVVSAIDNASIEGTMKSVGRMLEENGAALSLLMSVLALIAWCPVEMSERKPKGMWLHNRRPRTYMQHNVVHLRIPIRTAYTYIKKGMAEIVRRRRHRVREHFRVYHAGTPKERRVLVHEHMRGDAALGYVKQEYEVST